MTEVLVTLVAIAWTVSVFALGFWRGWKKKRWYYIKQMAEEMRLRREPGGDMHDAPAGSVDMGELGFTLSMDYAPDHAHEDLARARKLAGMERREPRDE